MKQMIIINRCFCHKHKNDKYALNYEEDDRYTNPTLPIDGTQIYKSKKPNLDLKPMTNEELNKLFKKI